MSIEKAYAKKYREEHKLKMQKDKKIYRINHKTEIKEYRKKYNRLHRQENREYISNYRKNIYHKLADNMRTRIWMALKGIWKSTHTETLLGYTIEFLKKHLESQFKPGMKWSNYGKWHIDHIIPCVSFDLSIPENQYKCFNYQNLQPLWAIENFRKHDKILI